MNLLPHTQRCATLNLWIEVFSTTSGAFCCCYHFFSNYYLSYLVHSPNKSISLDQGPHFLLIKEQKVAAMLCCYITKLRWKKKLSQIMASKRRSHYLTSEQEWALSAMNFAILVSAQHSNPGLLSTRVLANMSRESSRASTENSYLALLGGYAWNKRRFNQSAVGQNGLIWCNSSQVRQHWLHAPISNLKLASPVFHCETNVQWLLPLALVCTRLHFHPGMQIGR